jgi:hypothetical protein
MLASILIVILFIELAFSPRLDFGKAGILLWYTKEKERRNIILWKNT